ncbi:hypothetical protein [uncultured Oscillibacter sp.]|jgi:hypothetical protein|nr:hypothetical protein [uncultured Oscillibacter sp.]
MELTFQAATPAERLYTTGQSNKQRICWGKFSLTGACRPYDPAK